MKHVKIFGYFLAGSFILIFLLTFIQKKETKDEKTYKVTRDKMIIEISSTGEVIAPNSVEIMPPDLFFDREINVYQTTINKMAAEGTILKKGDFIASLDGSKLDRQISDLKSVIDRETKKLESQKLDSTLQVTNKWNSILKAKDAIQGAKFTLEQSTYESKAIQRQAKIKADRADREHENTKRSYEKSKLHQHSRIKRIDNYIKWNQKKLDKYELLKSQFTINAPIDGMLVYIRQPYGNRQKVKQGSMIHKFGMYARIATIPNLNELCTEIYINEIDITKLKIGQEVEVSADAIPDINYLGTIKTLASFGKMSSDNAYRLFKVTVQLQGDISELKPAMTTKNRIVLNEYNDVLFVPLNAIYGENNHTFIYKKDGLGTVRQEVTLGDQNNESTVVLKGLNENDIVLVKEPNNKENLKTIFLENSVVTN